MLSSPYTASVTKRQPNARIGRPPLANPRTRAIPIRLTDDEIETLRAAARRRGIPVSHLIRHAALEAARR